MIALAAALLLFIGTQADPTPGNPGGIFSVRLDSDTGQFTSPTLAASTLRPGFLALHPGGRILYATTDTRGFQGPSTQAPSVFGIEAETGLLHALPSQLDGGSPLTCASVSAEGNALFAASYREGGIFSFPIDKEGNPGPPVTAITNTAVAGIDHGTTHPHCAIVSPDNRHLYVCDLGRDRIYCYLIASSRPVLTPATTPFIATAEGTGPRHGVISSDGDFLYVIGERDSSISVFKRDPASGALTQLQKVPTLPDGFDGKNATAEIRIHPNERFVYGSNRGHDSIALFARNASTGLLTPVETVPCGGKHPRNFALSPDGAWLVCANRDSDNLVAFRVDDITGRLSQVGEPASVPKPTYVLFASGSMARMTGDDRKK